ncbi:MAG: hypothetical protein JJ975_04000 [Bacteroidia bacterium]|nr:hypothetical protein [Bacteroidia bacterium]
MRLIEVTNTRLFDAFLDVASDLYQHDPHYIPHLRQDIKKVLWDDVSRNDVGLWLVEHEEGYVARMAAFVNDTGKGGFGFFECINNQDAANLLFNRGESWLRNKGCVVLEAPVNYGERDRYWGLLLKRTTPVSYQENYNPPYYESLFKSYGFEVSFQQSTQEVSLDEFKSERIAPLAQRAFDNPHLEFRHVEKSKLRQYAEDFATVYNEAWQVHSHYKTIDADRVLSMMKAMRPVLREDLLWFAYAHGKPIGFYLSVADVNQWFKYVNGNLNFWNQLKFLYVNWRIPVTRIRGLIFGVVPAYQQSGVALGLMMKVFDVIRNDRHLRSNELAWIGDFNPKMLALLRSIGAVETKLHVTFEKKINFS